MISTVTILAVVLDTVVLFWLMDRLRFLAPFRDVIWKLHSTDLLCWLGLLFGNTFAIMFALYRKFFLKDTGKKLEQLEKQLGADPADMLRRLGPQQ